MKFMPMRSLAVDQRTVLTNLRQDGEVVITNNGQPTILMIDLADQDLVDVVGFFRKRKKGQALAEKQNNAINHFLADQRGDQEEVFDEEFDELMSTRFNIRRELDL